MKSFEEFINEMAVSTSSYGGETSRHWPLDDVIQVFTMINQQLGPASLADTWRGTIRVDVDASKAAQKGEQVVQQLRQITGSSGPHFELDQQGDSAYISFRF